MERGFSLIEMLLGVSMIASVVAIALPSLAEWIPRHAVRREARAVQLVVERAYTLAVVRSVPVSVQFLPSQIIATSATTAPLFSHPLPASITARIKGNQDSSLVLYPSHTASPATIEVLGPSYRCSVIVSLRGRTRLECA
ncbi:MAG: hypothetical protein RL518_1637 [Pseudomonadota bacterium]|jgi:prepilin-type N-terminal cleavage/methylation domain-containing protein